jgi:hypothetical protein
MTHDRPDDEEPVTIDREDAAAPVIDAELQDQGLGNIRPEEAAPLDPDDEGIGNIRPEEAPGPGPADEGIGSLGTNG